MLIRYPSFLPSKIGTTPFSGVLTDRISVFRFFTFKMLVLHYIGANVSVATLLSSK